jgi:hypothetical protein
MIVLYCIQSLFLSFLRPSSVFQKLEPQLSTLNSSQSFSSTELDPFRHKVEDTEREKRDLLGAVSRLKEDSAQRDGMLSIILLFRWSCASELH